MSEHGDKMIAEATAKLREAEQKVVDLKKFINHVREFEGLEPLYRDLDQQSSASLAAIRPDQFYGQPLATVVRRILTMRKSAEMGAATVAEIYDVMVGGGYAFETTNPENAKRALRISLTKNPIFHKLPGGEYGLTEWYPNLKPPRIKRSESSELDDSEDVEVEESTDAEAVVEKGGVKPVKKGE